MASTVSLLVSEFGREIYRDLFFDLLRNAAYSAALLLVLLFVVIYALRSETRQIRVLGAALAAEGVVFADGPAPYQQPLRGTWRSRDVVIAHMKYGRRGPWRTSVFVSRGGPPVDLALTREGIKQRIVKAFGGQDLETQDVRFDDAYRIVSGDGDRATFALDPEVRKGMLAQGVRRLVMEDHRVHVEVEGRLMDARALVDLMRLGAHVAERVEVTA